MFRKVLVANRGEIAVRVIRACRKLGIRTVAVYSDPDASALHAAEADEARRIGPGPVAQSYLRAEQIVEAALQTGADAIHPGYGLLSENPVLAERCEAAGIAFVGPSAQAIRAMGSKVEARRIADSLGIPIVPGTDGPVSGPAEASRAARGIGFPVLLKASAGGGGIGMTVVWTPEELESRFAPSAARVTSYFGDGTLFLERYLERPRHVEVQILADRAGRVAALGERDCSVQRRHQKILEESPAPRLEPSLRASLASYAVRLASHLRYTGVGTVEFLISREGEPFFLEMNTRLQVEHPVTEEVHGEDLVARQLRIADGEALPAGFGSDAPVGHAMECRICAEDSQTFLPSPGRLTRFRPPEGEGLRNDVGVREGDEISPYYDSLFAKFIAFGRDREEARRRLEEGLSRYVADGVKTNIPLLRRIVRDEAFVEGRHDTGLVQDLLGR